MPFTVADLQRAVFVLEQKPSLKNLRTKIILLLSFAGFLRFSECQNLRRSDIKIFRDHAMLFIEKSKTDIYREGHWLFLARLNSDLCPVSNLEHYLRNTRIDSDSNEFIFRSIKTSKRKNFESLRRSNKPISYSTVRDEYIGLLKNMKLNPRNYGLHSLRSGGVTAAANLGVSDRLLMKHGRWKSAYVKNRYISESIESLLFVSSNLGL